MSEDHGCRWCWMLTYSHVESFFGNISFIFDRFHLADDDYSLILWSRCRTWCKTHWTLKSGSCYTRYRQVFHFACTVFCIYLNSFFWNSFQSNVKASVHNCTHRSLSFVDIPAGLGSVIQFVRASAWMKESTVIQNNCVSWCILELSTQFDLVVYCY